MYNRCLFVIHIPGKKIEVRVKGKMICCRWGMSMLYWNRLHSFKHFLSVIQNEIASRKMLRSPFSLLKPGWLLVRIMDFSISQTPVVLLTHCVGQFLLLSWSSLLLTCNQLLKVFHLSLTKKWEELLRERLVDSSGPILCHYCECILCNTFLRR